MCMDKKRSISNNNSEIVSKVSSSSMLQGSTIESGETKMISKPPLYPSKEGADSPDRQFGNWDSSNGRGRQASSSGDGGSSSLGGGEGGSSSLGGGEGGGADKKKPKKTPSRVSAPVLPSSSQMNNIAIRRRRTIQLRVLFVFSLVATVVICTSIAFIMIRDLEDEMGHITYEGVAERALQSARSDMLRKIDGGGVMAGIMERRFPNASQWPMVNLNGYAVTASEIADLSGGTSMALIVLVKPEEAEEFERHAQQHFIDQGYPEGSGKKEDLEFGIRIRHNGTNVLDREGNITVYDSKNTILTPVLDHSTPGSPMLMYNVHVSSTAVDSIIDCSNEAAKLQHDPETSPQCSVVTGFKMSTVTTDLVGLIYKPIYPQHDPTTLVGVIGLSVNFNEVLVNSIPHYYNGAVAVISTRTKTQDHTTLDYDTVTYDIISGEPMLRGEGDLHDPNFDDYARSIVLNDVHTDATDEVVYTLTIYPSTFEQFRSQNPWIVVIGFVCVILASTMIFLVYDYLMRRQSSEQEVILDLKRRFVRFISHEIRTPLNTVCMGLELLENDIRMHAQRLFQGKTSGSLHSTNSADPVEIKTETETKTDVTSCDVAYWYEITNDIQENASSAVMILNDLLNYDKIENGTLQLEVGDVEIISLVERTVHKFHVQAASKKINLSLHVNRCKCGTFQEYHSGQQTKLPRPRNAVVIGDEMRLGQVISNLISNSLKFTPSGGSIEIQMDHLSPPDCAASRQTNDELGDHIVSSNRDRRGSVVVSVKDTGVGMTPDQIEMVFSEGIQFDKNKLQAGGGSGLGLCISKGIIDRHDGYIKANSHGPGLGSIFSFELPLYTANTNDIESFHSESGDATILTKGVSNEMICPDSAITSVSADESEKTCATSLLNSEISVSPIHPRVTIKPTDDKPKSHHILVVEDVPSSQKMLIRLLQRAGHTCESAWNGQEAIDKVKATMAATDGLDIEEGGNVAKPFDTILMDFEMPILNGPDATEEIRKLGFNRLIAGVTGNVLDEDVKYFISKGADAVLGKPVGMDRLNEFWMTPNFNHRRSTVINRAMLAKIDSIVSTSTKESTGA